MNSFPYFDILLLAIVAGFLILRLRSVLGRRTGHQEPHERPLPRRMDHGSSDSSLESEDNVVNLPGRRNGERGLGDVVDAPPPDASEADEPGAGREESGLAGGLAQIRHADPEFDQRHFLSGSQAAFGMIVEAFAKGDTPSLRPLLGDDLYDDFSAAMRARLAEDQVLETTIHAMDDARLLDAEMEGSVARITVRFTTSQTNVTRDGEGTVLEGDPDRRDTVTDIWTFERNTRSTDPNWRLVETATED